jgi:hypothetical protein
MGATVSRRRFLQGLIAAVAAGSGIAWLIGRDALQLTTERMIDLAWNPSRRLRSHFSYLDLDPAGVEMYVADYERHIRRLSRLRAWPDDVYTRFLLSTDFFQNKGDEARRIRYVSFYHPYVTYCYNPLTRIEYRSP